MYHDNNDKERITLLQGVVGSHAYGLATEDSDVDTLGVFTYRTSEYLGLSEPKETHVTTNPDITEHEVRKYLRLALKCNPTVLELMWLPKYTVQVPPFADDLREYVRTWVLSQKYVRDAYLGYATQQFNRLKNRGDGSFSSDTRKRTAKHARHLARLLYQGVELYLYGRLTVKLSNPEKIRNFGEDVANGNIDAAQNLLNVTETVFDRVKSPLPMYNELGTKAVNHWLIQLRRNYM